MRVARSFDGAGAQEQEQNFTKTRFRVAKFVWRTLVGLCAAAANVWRARAMRVSECNAILEWSVESLCWSYHALAFPHGTKRHTNTRSTETHHSREARELFANNL